MVAVQASRRVCRECRPNGVGAMQVSGGVEERWYRASLHPGIDIEAWNPIRVWDKDEGMLRVKGR